jgi:lycopene cyclase domain-containing protein
MPRARWGTQHMTTYIQMLLFFGLIPFVVLVGLAPRLIRYYKGIFFWVVLCIMWVSVLWESTSVDRIWFYSPKVILGPRLLRIPLEEYAFFVLDGLLVTSVTLLLHKRNSQDAA